ncbi:hypothetical protein ACJJTC_005859 [Scirpophaga incertulas]
MGDRRSSLREERLRYVKAHLSSRKAHLSSRKAHLSSRTAHLSSRKAHLSSLEGSFVEPAGARRTPVTCGKQKRTEAPAALAGASGRRVGVRTRRLHIDTTRRKGANCWSVIV